MSHLFLQSFDANSGLSISLRHGQSCTIGASAVADYRVNAIGVSAVHCRIVCRPSGGFVECLEDENFIVINGAYRRRSRICDGDLLKIGSISVSVKRPTPKVGLRSFNIDLGNQAETDGPDFLIDIDADEPDQAVAPEDIIDLEMPEHKNSATQDGADETISSFDSEVQSKMPAKSLKPNFVTSRVTKTQNVFKQSSRPFFEFDSAGPANPNLFEDELELTSQAEDLISPLPADESEDRSGGSLSPTDTGKFLRWIGDDAVDVLHRMQGTEETLNIYRILSGQMKLVSEEDIEKHLNAKAVPAVFLFSKHSSEDLMSHIRSRKWIDRIGHPQAVNMFLALSPKRMVSDFFAMVGACLLLQNDEVELVREMPLLHPSTGEEE